MSVPCDISSMMDSMSIRKDLDIIDHDVCLILECNRVSNETDIFHMCPFHRCKLVKGQYTNNEQLYNDMLGVLKSRGMINDLLELMPYIDDYIGYFGS